MATLRELLDRDSSLLEYVKYQTDDLCLRAVKSNGLLLKYVRFQTPAICLAAVNQNGLALEFVHGYAKNLEICIRAAKQNPLAVRFAEDADNEEMFAIIRAVPDVCQHLRRFLS